MKYFSIILVFLIAVTTFAGSMKWNELTNSFQRELYKCETKQDVENFLSEKIKAGDKYEDIKVILDSGHHISYSPDTDSLRFTLFKPSKRSLPTDWRVLIVLDMTKMTVDKVYIYTRE